MIRLDTLFFDVGGVCLTNGWDTDARLAAASHFVLNVEETEGRHQALADGFERGELSLSPIRQGRRPCTDAPDERPS